MVVTLDITIYQSDLRYMSSCFFLFFSWAMSNIYGTLKQIIGYSLFYNQENLCIIFGLIHGSSYLVISILYLFNGTILSMKFVIISIMN